MPSFVQRRRLLPAMPATPAFIGVLDAYTTGLAGLWSVSRRLLTSYNGSLIRVRRDSDNAETNIGATATGGLDTTALTAFVGSNSAFVTKIYDQVGTNDFSQAVAASQPQIVNAGSIVVVGSSPAINLTGNTRLAASAFSGTAGTLYCKQQKDADPGLGGDAILSDFGTSGQRDHMPFSDGNVYYGAMSTTRHSCGNPTPDLSNPFLMTAVSANNSWILRLQSAAFYSTTSNTVAWGTPSIGKNATAGKFVEFAFYNVAHNSSQWANLEPIFQP